MTFFYQSVQQRTKLSNETKAYFVQFTNTLQWFIHYKDLLKCFLFFLFSISKKQFLKIK